jgi:hypothetical protein
MKTAKNAFIGSFKGFVKEASSHDRAMTAEGLGLRTEFEPEMKRRLSRLGIFVEVEGKCYFDERMKQVETFRSIARTGGDWGRRIEVPRIA